MDLNTHIQVLEKKNRILFSGRHYWLLSLAFVILVLFAMYLIEPIFGVAFSGFVAFFLNYFYSKYAFKKLNDRISLLQTKLEQSQT
jgi:4-hydroxybenzoate polyprenyltransferase